MDLSFLDKSSGVTPLLVRLYDSHKLYSLAKDKKPLARAELTSAVSDLLGMELSPKESELVADVLVALMRQAETDLRQALAEKLSVMENVPLRLVLQIANDEIEVAGPVLKNSPVLGDMDLIYIIKSKGAKYWRAIAERKAMNEQIMNILADTRDFDTALNLIKNRNIRLSEHTLGVLSDLAQEEQMLASPLLRREEVTPDIAGKLYQFVGQEVKQYILDHFDLDKSVLIDAIDEVVLDFVDAAESNEFTPSGSDMKAAERFKEKGLLTIALMLGTLKRGQVKAFVAQFAQYSDLTPQTVSEILTQPSGQGLAVICKAYEVPKSDFISMYLLTNRVRSHGKMVNVNDISKAVGYFDRIRTDVAQNILKNSMRKSS